VQIIAFIELTDKEMSAFIVLDNCFHHMIKFLVATNSVCLMLVWQHLVN